MAKSIVVGALMLLGIFNNLAYVEMAMAGGVSHLSESLPSAVENAFNEHVNSQNSALELNEGTGSWLDSCSQQVVSGMLYRCTYADAHGTCEVTVWYQAWQANPFPDVSGCENRSKRSSESVPMPGGVNQLDTSDEGVLAAAAFSVDGVNMNLGSNTMFMYKMNRVVSATSQVVAGVKYVITLEMKETGCRNSMESYNMLEDCAFRGDDAQTQLCTVQILWQAWQEPADQYSEAGRPECSFTERPAKHSNNDAHMTQSLLGGDGHDLGNFGAFQEFLTKHNREYVNEKEKQFRFGVFQKNMKMAAKLQQTEKGTARYGATKFADVTEEEFKKYSTSGKWDLSPHPALKPAVIPNDPMPAAWDWRNHSAVTEVKNQGSCGSCWAFSVTGNIEGAWAIKKKKLVSLSEQELVDCDKVDEGCNGGLPSQAYQEIIRLGGLETETKYPYDAKDETCHFKTGDVKVYINGSLNISTDEGDMAAWLAQNGPISIGINAMAMQFYMGGISHPWSFLCSPNQLDHGVLIVGYGVQTGGMFGDKPYWIVKNSWGPDWGEKGYYLVYRGAGVCGLNKMPTSATVA